MSTGGSLSADAVASTSAQSAGMPSTSSTSAMGHARSIVHSTLPSHPSLPARPRLQGDFNQQDDFISFSDVLDDDERRDSDRDGARAGGRDHHRGAANARRGKKRSIGEVLQDKGKKRLTDVEKTTPWTRVVDWDRYASATEQLSAEIKAFTAYISPTDQEHELRSCVIESVRRLITRRWRDATVHPFGSFETRLYLPTGDIDLVVISSSIPMAKNQQRSILYAISALLTSSGIGTDVVVIAKAKVPIVKFVSVHGGFKIDISLNMRNGLSVSKVVNRLFKEVGEEPARSLVMVVKAFLNQRNMNEVYSGGLGSYSIICLVVSFLQLHPKLQRKEIDAYDNLGTLLIEFLELYGKNFNYDDVGICLSGGGSYYSKSRRGWSRPNQPYLLSVEDPADPTNDVSGGSHNILSVRQSIAGAFEVLTASVYYRTSIILARIAAAQNGVRLPTLSGRAIPHATGEESDEIDECRKSLLGAILGVTTEIEHSRIAIRKLSEQGVVQRSVGKEPSIFDEEGMLWTPETRSKKKSEEQQQSREAKPPAQRPLPAGLPPKPGSSNLSRGNSTDSVRSSLLPSQQGRPQHGTGDAGQRPGRTESAEDTRPSKQQKRDYATTGKPQQMEFRNGRVFDVSTPSPPPPPSEPPPPLPAAPPAPKNLINLDSPSPPPLERSLSDSKSGTGTGPSAKVEAVTVNDKADDEQDSRYAVQKTTDKAKNNPKQPEKITFIVHDSDSEDDYSPSEEEEGQIDSDDEIEQLFKQRKDGKTTAVAGSASNAIADASTSKDKRGKGRNAGRTQQQSVQPPVPESMPSGPRTRSRTLSAGQQAAVRPTMNDSPSKPVSGGNSKASSVSRRDSKDKGKGKATTSASASAQSPSSKKTSRKDQKGKKRKTSSDNVIDSQDEGSSASSSSSSVVLVSRPSRPFSNKINNNAPSTASSGGRSKASGPSWSLASLSSSREAPSGPTTSSTSSKKKQAKRDFWKAKAPIDTSAIGPEQGEESMVGNDDDTSDSGIWVRSK